MQTCTTKFYSQTTVDTVTWLHTEAFKSRASEMLTVMAAVLNPAQIIPCQYGEELSVAIVQRVPSLRTQIIGTSVTCLLSAWHMLRNVLGQLEVPALYSCGGREPEHCGYETIPLLSMRPHN